MINLELFERIKKKYGGVASWAVWEKADRKPKSNIGNLDIFDLHKNPSLLETLNNNVLMVGLSCSRPLITTEPFKNFHDTHPYANDFKIRYAFMNTQYYGAYMTDIIKNTVMISRQQFLPFLRENIALVHENIKLFREEISELDTSEPIILAFGVNAYNLLCKYLNKTEYSKLIKLTSYAQQISKEDYKKEVFNQINNALKS